MVDFSPPWAASGTRRAPTSSEQAIGFQCGAADPTLFNYLFHRIQSEIDEVIQGGGLTPSDGQLDQMWRAIKKYVDTRIAGGGDGGDGGTVDLSDYYTKLQSDDLFTTEPEVSTLIASALLNYYTKAQSNDRYYTKTATENAIAAALTDYYTKAQSNARYYTQSQVDAIVAAIRQVPVGQIAAFGRSEAPTGWLKCNGFQVSRTTYADLFAEIGTTFGEGDGSTTFRLPDLRGEFVRGWSDGKSTDPDRDLGTLQDGSVGEHVHSVGVVGSPDHQAVAALADPQNMIDLPNRTTSLTTTGSPVPRNVALLYCIKF